MTFLSKKYSRLIDLEYLSSSFDSRTHEELQRHIEDLLISYELEVKNSGSHHVKKLTRLTNAH